MAENKATAQKGAPIGAPNGEDQAAQDAAKLAAEQQASAELAAQDAAKVEAEKAEAEKLAQELAEAEAAAQLEGIFIVVSPFRDRDDFNKEHKVGDDVSDLDQDRLEDLISKGLVELK